MHTQTISPQGFIATRFGFDSALSTQVEHWLATCANPALRSAVETVFHAGTRPERQHAAAQVAELRKGAVDGALPDFLRSAIDIATSTPVDTRGVFSA